jgi:hypothetical protein
VLEVRAQALRIHRVGTRVDVDEVEARARLRDRLGGGDERHRHRDHRVARADAGGHQREAQAVGAVAHADRESGLAELRELLLERLHHFPADELAGIKGGFEDLTQIFAKLTMRRTQIEKRNSSRHGKASGLRTSRRGPSPPEPHLTMYRLYHRFMAGNTT